MTSDDNEYEDEGMEDLLDDLSDLFSRLKSKRLIVKKKAEKKAETISVNISEWSDIEKVKLENGKIVEFEGMLGGLYAGSYSFKEKPTSKIWYKWNAHEDFMTEIKGGQERASFKIISVIKGEKRDILSQKLRVQKEFEEIKKKEKAKKDELSKNLLCSIAIPNYINLYLFLEFIRNQHKWKISDREKFEGIAWKSIKGEGLTESEGNLLHPYYDDIIFSFEKKKDAKGKEYNEFFISSTSLPKFSTTFLLFTDETNRRIVVNKPFSCGISLKNVGFKEEYLELHWDIEYLLKVIEISQEERQIGKTDNALTLEFYEDNSLKVILADLEKCSDIRKDILKMEIDFEKTLEKLRKIEYEKPIEYKKENFINLFTKEGGYIASLKKEHSHIELLNINSEDLPNMEAGYSYFYKNFVLNHINLIKLLNVESIKITLKNEFPLKILSKLAKNELLFNFSIPYIEKNEEREMWLFLIQTIYPKFL